MTAWFDGLFVWGLMGSVCVLIVVLLVQRLYMHPALQKEEEEVLEVEREELAEEERDE